MASIQSASLSSSVDLSRVPTIFGSTLKLGEHELTLLRLSGNSSKISPTLRLKASRMSPAMAKETENTKEQTREETSNACDPFSSIKQNFLSFKSKYLENIEHFQKLAQSQVPKVKSIRVRVRFGLTSLRSGLFYQFMVIACADSRVCPSNILGFQPGEAFTVRNVANLVPPFETGPSETKAALEFSVNTLQVENILVIGHSRCGGINALMSMQEEEDSRSFIRSWVIVGKNARLTTKCVASNLSFDQQCQHCEKESINGSLVNLMSYPWIKERVAEGTLSLHGGYYDFTDCTFQKWTLDFKGLHQTANDENECSFKDREFWG